MRTWKVAPILFLFILIALLTSSAHARFLKGKSSFVVTRNDSLTEVKEHLIYLAVRDILSKELSFLGLDGEAFWGKYDRALEEKFLPIRERLQKTYREGKNGQTQSQKKAYRRALRKSRLKTQRNFGKILNILDSFKVSRVKHSTKNPDLRYLQMEGKVNRDKLERIYFRFAEKTAKRSVGKIYWTFNLSLDGGDWKHIGVEDKRDIYRPLDRRLVKKLKQALGKMGSDIVSTDSLDLKRIQTHLKLDERELFRLRNRKRAIETLLGAVWVHLDLSIGLGPELKELGRKEVESKGHLMVTDLMFNTVVYSEKMSIQKETIVSKALHSLGNKMADRLFRRVGPEFPHILSSLSKIPGNLNRVPVAVLGHGSYLELQELRDLLTLQGKRYRAKTFLDTFSLNQSQIIVEYMGSKLDLGNILNGIRGRNLKSGQRIYLERRDDFFQLKILVTARTSSKNCNKGKVTVLHPDKIGRRQSTANLAGG
ncbi:MAG: hypothetical protein OXB88_03705 [Bacteriovoracales bacterium]|nr:hypothetical protein [Bacteriovoracales bacterium]